MVISMDRWMDLSAPSERASESPRRRRLPRALRKQHSRCAVGDAEGGKERGQVHMVISESCFSSTFRHRLIPFCGALAMPPASPKWGPMTKKDPRIAWQWSSSGRSPIGLGRKHNRELDAAAMSF